MAKTTKYSLDDPKTKAILQKYYAGEKLTTQERAVINGLIRQHPDWFKGLAANGQTAQGQNGNVNVNLSSVQTNPALARSQYNQSRGTSRRNYGGGGGGTGAVSSPGGFKSSGRDAESLARRAGGLTPDSVLNAVTPTTREVTDVENRNKNVHSEVKNVRDGGYELNGRKYSAREVEAIVQRGMSGATMNWKDQAIYDKYLKEQRDAAAAVASEKARKDQSAAEERERQKKLADDLEKRNRDFAYWQKQQDYKRQNELADAATKAKAEEQKRKAEEQKRKDEERKWKLNKNGGGFRYTKKQRDDFDALTQAIVDAQSGVDQEGNFLDHTDRDENGLTEQERYIKRLEEQRDQIYYNPVASLEKDQSAQDRFDQSLVTKKFDDGSVVEGYVDDRGNFSEIKRPKADTSAEDARRKYILDRVEKDRGAFSKLDTKNEFLMEGGIPTSQKNPDYGREFDPLEAMRNAASDYDAVRDGMFNTPPASPDPQVEEPSLAADTTVNAPTDAANGNGWDEIKSFFGNAAPVEEVGEELPPDESFGGETCPECGGDLIDGVCQTCGYRS